MLVNQRALINVFTFTKISAKCESKFIWSFFVGPPLASEEEISIQTATPTDDDIIDDMNIAAESEVIKTSSLSSKRVVTFSMPSTIEASQNSLRYNHAICHLTFIAVAVEGIFLTFAVYPILSMEDGKGGDLGIS